VKDDGTARAWGYNDHGELGDGTNVNSTVPVTVSNLSGAVGVAAGSYHSLGLQDEGTAWGWGRNSHGQLGNGTTTDSNIPVEVSDLELEGEVLVTKYYYFPSTPLRAGGGQRVAMRRDGVLNMS
jgi:alpha-tubulin suppressor-like RCC1 family protein